MGMPPPARAALALTAIALVLTGCSDTSDPAPEAGASSAPASSACPASDLSAMGIGAPPGGAPASGAPASGAPAGAGIPMATSIAPSDTSTSTVLTVDNDPQIQCGAVPVKSTTNVVYSSPAKPDGSTKQLTMDILAPSTGAAAKPLVVYVPGGGFMSAQTGGSPGLKTFVAESGFVVASVQYRTIPDGAVYTDGIKDVKSAIRYLRAHATEYGINPDKVAVWGESAGGYLVSMVGTTNGDKAFEAGDNLDQSSDVQAVIDDFGSSDMTKFAADYDAKTKAVYATPDNFVATYILGPNSGKTVQDDPAAAARSNPITHVTASDPPFALFHGSKDPIVSPSQTLLLHNALTKAGVANTRYVVEGAGHGELSDPALAKLWTTTTVAGKMVDFLTANISG
jgi:acetyl esterase/lipase